MDINIYLGNFKKIEVRCKEFENFSCLEFYFDGQRLTIFGGTGDATDDIVDFQGLVDKIITAIVYVEDTTDDSDRPTED